MQLQAYLDRIGYTAGSENTPENLEKLIRCHLETVPFENLDFCYHPKRMSARPEDMYHKVVERRRGGVCFELNSIFYWLMQQLGYETYPLHVRLPHGPDIPAPIVHRGNMVILDGKKYYCDVGYGGPGPKGLVAVDGPREQVIDGEPFQIQRDGLYVTIFRMADGEWTQVIRFADVPAVAEDFDYLLFAFTADPESHFVKKRIVNLCLPNHGHLALTDMEFTALKDGVRTHRVLQSEEEVQEVLREEFGIE